MLEIIEFAIELFTNKLFLSIFFSWLIANLTKTSIILATEKDKKLSNLYRSGGMPSTHTSSVVGLTFGIYLSEGVGPIFIIALALAIVVTYDSMGVRFETTKHAKFLNELIKRQHFDIVYFKENIGHNLPEVIVGGIIGLIVPWIVFLF